MTKGPVLGYGLRPNPTYCLSLNDRIVRLDCAMQVVVGEPDAAASPVEAQVARLEQAFAGARHRVSSSLS